MCCPLKDFLTDEVDVFLPFDLESTFSAGLVLALVKGIHPKLLPNENWLKQILLALDFLAINGINQASTRKTEIEKLTTVRWDKSSASRESLHNNEVSVISPTSTDLPSLGDPFFDDWEFDEALSGAQLISLADALEFPEAADLITF